MIALALFTITVLVRMLDPIAAAGYIAAGISNRTAPLALVWAAGWGLFAECAAYLLLNRFDHVPFRPVSGVLACTLGAAAVYGIKYAVRKARAS